MNPVKYLSEVRKELILVAWPKPTDVLKLTLLVIFISIIVGIYLGGLDIAFTKLVGFILSK